MALLHDAWNLGALGGIAVWTLGLLWTGDVSWAYWHTVVAYLACDFVWIAAFPRSVKAPVSVLVHHLVTLILLMVPYTYPRFFKYAVADLVIEGNTWLLIARRRIPRSMPRTRAVCTAAFFSSWVLIRLVWYPYLLFVFAYVERVRSAAVLQLAICGMQVVWSWSLFKPKTKQPTRRPRLDGFIG